MFRNFKKLTVLEIIFSKGALKKSSTFLRLGGALTPVVSTIGTTASALHPPINLDTPLDAFLNMNGFSLG
jgi:hypothetical protein